MTQDYHWTTELGGDAGFERRRGQRARTGAPVLAKLSRAGGARMADAAALQRECAIAAELSDAATLLPRIVEAGRQTLLVMEDPGGEPLSALLAAGPLGVGAALQIALQLAAKLAELHGRGWVHHGLRPDAVWYDSVNAGVWLIDFADAGRASSRLAATVTTLSTARLMYVSPEQTGRMDRAADHRSDLYALGVLVYEALCRTPPIRSDDPLALIHWHIAGLAVEPCRTEPSVPQPLSDIVMKLLAKAPDERYQTARGLLADLERCAGDWATHSRIEPFALGQHDGHGELVVSSRLYGREAEVGCLLGAFERACVAQAGCAEMVLVEGYAGIGKTTLIQHLYRPIVRQKGYFIAGKFDQVVRGVPFGALIQAFRGLVQQWLTESEAQLARWRDTLRQALGNNGGVLAEVIPEIEFIMGPQPVPPALGSTESQNRFQRVLQNFVAALAQPAHPLVLFLDDLQWADAATLGLLEPLLTGGEIRSLLLVGACRDNELELAPHLARTLALLESAGVALQRVTLGPLTGHDLSDLVADTLRCEPARAEPLALLIERKTGGNPFFVTQFLKMLEREGHLRFDVAQACWTYRIAEIADAPLADNVIDLMTGSIRRLSSKAQYALTLAACIGNRFDQGTLAIVSEQSAAQTSDDLERAIDAGLIVAIAPVQARADDAADAGQADASAFMFLHDRVQQAAYALIPEDRRRMVHLTVGRLLRARTSPEQLDARLFDVVHHLNLGRALIGNADERWAVARLDLAAGRRAKSSTAYDTALELLSAGSELIDVAAWDADYELCFALRLEAAECEYLCGHFETALECYAQLARLARTPIDQARVARLRSVQLENMGRYAESIATARDGLALFQVAFPDDEQGKGLALARAIDRIESLRAGRDIAALVALPTMADPEVRMVMSMLTDIWSAAYIIGDPTLARLISATLVRLSLEHGNVEESAYGYVTHAITVGAMRGEYAQAFEYGRLALAVNQRFDDTRRRAKIYQQFNAHVNFWCEPIGSCCAYAREACRSGLESGDFLYAAYGAGTEPWAAMAATQDLAQFERDYEPSIALIEKLKNTGFADSVRLLVNWSRALQGRTDGPLSFTDASLDEATYLQTYRDHPFFMTIHAIARLQLCCLLGSKPEALAAVRHAGTLVRNVPGTIWPLICDLWSALALAASHDDQSSDDRAHGLAELTRAQSMFESLSGHCAQNFRCPALLLAGEIARIDGRIDDALALYARAIEFTEGLPLLNYRALAHELCGRCLVDHARPALGRMHLAQARACYARWGAAAKVEAMQRQYPVLVVRGSAVSADSAGTLAAHDAHDAAGTSTAGERLDGLDLVSLTKATQAIAAEIELDALLAQLMHIAIENAGAERGALVLEGEDGPKVHALDPLDAPLGSEAVPLETSCSVPIGIVNYVRRTARSVVLAQADADEQHGADPYVLRCKPRSLLCVPVQRQARLVGVLYLEHSRVGGAFTADRIRTLQVLSTQAAISLENARLFARQKEEIAERERAQAQLAAALAEVERMSVQLEAENSYLRRDLIANVSHDLRTPLVSIRGYLEVLAAKGDSLDLPKRQSYLATAVRQTEHLGTLIDDLFELAKLDFKGISLQRESFQLAELASDVLQKFQLLADGKQIALRLAADPKLPRVHADLSLIERVLDNLVGNALKFTSNGGCVSISLSADARAVRVCVDDDGAGIPKADLPFIFDRFYRAPGGRDGSGGGAGLGLAITKRILELHGGDIAAQSGETGATFRFELPLPSTLEDQT
ncbi:MAG: AAA family ATPase [Burkholderiaceae bacterium]